MLACDLAVIAEHAYVGQVGVRVGSVACGGATQWLPITVGDKRAREMLFTNRPIPARLALEWGLVNRVAPSVRRGGELVGNASPEEIEKAQKGADGYSIDLAPLDEEVDRLAQELLADVPGVRSLHEAAGRTSGRTSRGRSPCGTRRTGWPFTTPTTSPSKG